MIGGRLHNGCVLVMSIGQHFRISGPGVLRGNGGLYILFSRPAITFICAFGKLVTPPLATVIQPVSPSDFPSAARSATVRSPVRSLGQIE
jgi:hypothetical protein